MLKLLKAKHLKAPTKENPKDPTYLGKRRLYLVSKGSFQLFLAFSNRRGQFWFEACLQIWSNSTSKCNTHLPPADVFFPTDVLGCFKVCVKIGVPVRSYRTPTDTCTHTYIIGTYRWMLLPMEDWKSYKQQNHQHHRDQLVFNMFQPCFKHPVPYVPSGKAAVCY